MFILLLQLGCSSPDKKSGEGSTMDSASVYVPEHTMAVSSKAHVDTVEISNLKFVPDQLKIHEGDTVIWINNDLVTHCVTEATNMSWTSHEIAAGATWKRPFNHSADYYCAIHEVMKGKIVVSDSSTATASVK